MNKIILASASPRRKEILEMFFDEFEIMPSDFQEVITQDEKPEIQVMSLAFQKCFDISEKVSEDSIVISADTLVYKERVLGKPKNREDAFNMLKLLSGTSHKVITGISIICKSKGVKIVDNVVSNVYFKDITDEDIENYINTGEPLDKAGAYGIQGLGSILVEKIEGDYMNIVGLPISTLSSYLKEHFDINLLRSKSIDRI